MVVNCYMVIEFGVEVVFVLNKIDLLVVNFENVIEEIEDVIGIDVIDVMCCSVKIGFGVEDVFELLIVKVLLLKGDLIVLLQVLIIDLWFDNYVGVVMFVCIVNGMLCLKDKIKMMVIGVQYLVEYVGVFMLKLCNFELLLVGQVGFIIVGIKELMVVKVGDIVMYVVKVVVELLLGFKEVKLQVFVGLYLVEVNQYDVLCELFEKLKLNDVLLQYELEVLQVFGFGFCCGFFGLLYMEIVQEWFECEFDMDFIMIVLMVVYEVVQSDGLMIMVENLVKMLEFGCIVEVCELIVIVNLYMLQDYVGLVIMLCEQKCGLQINMQYYGCQVQFMYEILMVEIVFDFFDCLKLVLCGYVLMDYEFKEYCLLDVVKVDMLINGDKVDVLLIIVYWLQL